MPDDLLVTVRAALDKLDRLNDPANAEVFEYAQYRDELRKQAIPWLRLLLDRCKQAEQRLSDAYIKDRGKTKKINILVAGVSRLEAELDLLYPREADHE